MTSKLINFIKKESMLTQLFVFEIYSDNLIRIDTQVIKSDPKKSIIFTTILSNVKKTSSP
jgi:hypothetical protein